MGEGRDRSISPLCRDELKYPRVRYGGGGRRGAEGARWALLLPLCNRQNPGATRKPRERGEQRRRSRCVLGGRGGSGAQLATLTRAPISPLSPQWGIASSTRTVSLPERERERGGIGSEEGRDPQAGCVRESGSSEEGARAGTGAAANKVGRVWGWGPRPIGVRDRGGRSVRGRLLEN